MSSYKFHPRTDVNPVRVINSLDVNVVSGSLGNIDLAIDKVEISGNVNIGNETLTVEISGGTFLTQPVEISGGIQVDLGNGNALPVEISGGTYLTQPVEISGGIQGDVNITNEHLNVEISGGTFLTQPVEISGGIQGDVNITNEHLNVEISGGTYLTQPVEISGGIQGDVNITNEHLNVEISGGTYLTQPVEISGGIQGDVNITNEHLNVEISGGTFLTQPVEISGGIQVDLGNGDALPVEISGETNVNLVSYNDDAFGRLRVSEPYSLFDFTSIFGKDPLNFDEEISGDEASSTHNEGSYIEMSVNSSNGASVIRQSRECVPYQPGKSKLHYLTGVLTDNLSANITSRIGSFDASYGHFFEYSNGVMSVVERDNTSEIRITQDNWIDPLDGTGRSGVTIDFTKAQIYYFDQEWLGIGRVRAGIIANGIYYQCVNFSHNGSEAITKPYYRLAKLPIRYEIRSNGGAGNMRMICGSIMSEGGYNNIGTTFGSKTFVLRQLTTAHNLCPIISIRLRDLSGTEPHQYTTAKLKFFDILNRDFSDVLGWKILLNPTLTLNSGSFVDYDPSYSSVSICYHTVDGASRDTLTGGIVLESGYGNQRGNFSLITSPDEIISSIGLGRSISGDSGTITLAAQALTGTINLAASISWVEIR
jgi:hypothetical protein